MKEMKRLNVKGLAIALGATWSLGVLMKVAGRHRTLR